MQEKEYILRVQDLKTDFKVGRKIVHAVGGVTFDVRRGKTLCIVGESGCGKSVTAHSIMQLLPPNGMIAGGSIDYYTNPGHARSSAITNAAARGYGQSEARKSP